MLEPTDRLEQLCDYTAMITSARIRAASIPTAPSPAPFAPPKIGPNSIDANGGAFRSRGHWYEMCYSCAATPDHMQVLSFKLTIGAEIPETKWAGYGLWQ